MLQRIFCFLFCGVLLVSCEFFQKKELPNNAVIDTVIDFNSVDSFPLFPSCETIPSEDKQRICSQIKLSEHMYASLVNLEIATTKKINDTIFVKLHIDALGKVTIINFNTSEFLSNQLPKLDSLMQHSVSSLPNLKPAIKRGIPVATEFTLPIIVRN